RHAADVVIFATGFDTQHPPYAGLGRGDGGETLADHWRDGMRSAGSVMVPGFPDLYVLNGPNATLGHNSSILVIEAQVDFAVRHIAGRSGPVEPLPAAEAAFDDEVARRSAGTPWVAEG
ncbi:4-hydroxyacetophenone monooxygenase, partial [Mesorhizobium japonicum]